MIGLVTDSSSQIPPSLIEKFDVRVVPLVVDVDGQEFHEGVDLDADGFWSRFAGGHLPVVKTSQPSPGAFLDVYRQLENEGCDQIVSVHIGEAHSGTINSARLAAEIIDSQVLIVDSGTASFGVSCCVWEAGEVIAEGGSAVAAADQARLVAPRIGTAFIIQALDFARAGGRFDPELPPGADGVIVLAGHGSDLDIVATASTIDDLCDRMVEQFVSDGGPIRAGVCLADPATVEFTAGIERRLREADIEVELVRYRVGPSIAAHTGPGTAGGFWYTV